MKNNWGNIWWFQRYFVSLQSKSGREKARRAGQRTTPCFAEITYQFYSQHTQHKHNAILPSHKKLIKPCHCDNIDRPGRNTLNEISQTE